MPLPTPDSQLPTNLQRITITPNQIDSERTIELTAEQQHYLTRVLRLPSGAKFQAIDGTGNLYLAELERERARIVEFLTIADGDRQSDLTLICALPKGSHFDDIVRACTELGVTSILPALSERTLLDPSPQKLQRWRKIAREAAEQSERLTIPAIADPQPLGKILTGLPDPSLRYCCEARGDRSHLLACVRADLELGNLPIIIAIGPEGGWTEAEIELAIACNFQLVSLGGNILRTITAPIVAVSIVTAAIACAVK